jgi:hypothetical protein
MAQKNNDRRLFVPQSSEPDFPSIAIRERDEGQLVAKRTVHSSSIMFTVLGGVKHLSLVECGFDCFHQLCGDRTQTALRLRTGAALPWAETGRSRYLVLSHLRGCLGRSIDPYILARADAGRAHHGVSCASAAGVYRFYCAACDFLRQARFALREISRVAVANLAALLYGSFLWWDDCFLFFHNGKRHWRISRRTHFERNASDIPVFLSRFLVVLAGRMGAQRRLGHRVRHQGQSRRMGRLPANREMVSPETDSRRGGFVSALDALISSRARPFLARV